MYLGIDIGTSAIKIVLISENQEIIGISEKKLCVFKKETMFSEQDPEDWLNALKISFFNLKKKCSKELSSLKSIGLTGQMHTSVCIDATGKVLYPAILWNDGRSHKECKELTELCPEFETLGRNKLMPGFTAPKILWIKKNEKHIFSKINKILLPKDYIRYKLTNEYSTDVSDASGTLWLDVNKRKWSETLLNSCGLNLNNVPFLQESKECSGYLLSKFKLLLGIKTSRIVKVIAGASDNAAGALSVGVYKEGDVMLSLGTSGVYFAPTKKINNFFEKGLHVFCNAIKNTWTYMGVILSAASVFTWWKKILNLSSEKDVMSLSEKCVKKIIPIFLPYLNGERTPYNDPFAKASFVGITSDTNREDLCRSVLEGVAFAFFNCQTLIEKMGLNIDNVSIIGGGSKSFHFGSIISTILNYPLNYYESSSIGPAYGAARLAIYENVDIDFEKIFYYPKIKKTILPNNKLDKEIILRRSIYKELYFQLKNIFRKQEIC